MRRKYRERFPRHPGLANPPCITVRAVMHVGMLTSSGGGGENVPGIPGARTTRNFAYLVRGPRRPADWDTIRFHSESRLQCRTQQVYESVVSL